MKLFIWIRRYRATVNGILFSIISTLFLNTISTMDDVGAKDIQQVVLKIRFLKEQYLGEKGKRFVIVMQSLMDGNRKM